jgi:exosortase K
VTATRVAAPPGAWRVRLQNGAVILAALGVAWKAKEFYSRANVSELLWVLTPTTRLVEWFTGARFELEAHRGFLCRDLRYEIVPACAGVNFMVVAFVSLVAGLVHTRSSAGGRLGLLALATGAAYATTLLGNASRIAIAMAMHQAGVSLGPLTEDRLHCATGALVYLLFLGGLFTLGARATGADRELAN